MQAPVFRHLDTKATYLGLSFPVEWSVILLVVTLGAGADAPVLGLLAAGALYATLVLAGRGQPENFLQNWFLFQYRKRLTRGVFTSAARERRTPRFPFGSRGRVEPLQTRCEDVIRRVARRSAPR